MRADGTRPAADAMGHRVRLPDRFGLRDLATALAGGILTEPSSCPPAPTERPDEPRRPESDVEGDQKGDGQGDQAPPGPASRPDLGLSPPPRCCRAGRFLLADRRSRIPLMFDFAWSELAVIVAVAPDR